MALAWPRSAPGPAISVDRIAGLEQEVHDRRCGPDKESRDAGRQHGLTAGIGVLVVIGMAPESPGGGADDEADEGGYKGPPTEAIGKCLDRGLAW